MRIVGIFCTVSYILYPLGCSWGGVFIYYLFLITGMDVTCHTAKEGKKLFVSVAHNVQCKIVSQSSSFDHPTITLNDNADVWP